MPASDSSLPRITIVTPSFNQGKYIERTIRSVLEQEYPNLDYIVVDGGSTDETLDILRRYEGRLHCISEKDSGQSEAINKGFRLAKGEILGWLNSDDIYLPGALEKVGRYFVEHPDVMMVYGEGYMLDEEGNVKRRFPFTEPKFDLWKLIYFGDYILQQSTFFRRSVFDSIDLLGESLHYTLDWDLFIRIGKRFRVDYIPEYLGAIREHGEAKTSVGGVRRFQEIKSLIRKHGVMRYPLSYFNYMWDAYGKKLPAATDSRNGAPRLSERMLGLGIDLAAKAFAVYQRNLPQGCYADGWVGKRTMLVLPNPTPQVSKSRLVLYGEANGTNTPFRLTIAVNRKSKKSFRIFKPGPFEITCDLPSSVSCDDSFHVELRSSRAFVPSALGLSQDRRQLGFLLGGTRLT
jgi:glycosyltransferase involved in cell wall biosynthesis